MKRLLNIYSILLITIISCSTPPEVKQLSLKQIEYFDIAISSISVQSEALIMATEQIIEHAKIEIKKIEDENKAKMENLTIEVIPTLSDDKKRETTVKMLNEISETVKESELARAKLDQDLMKIKNKSDELITYLKKMKEVHLAIDAYIQSKKAGEIIVRDLLNYSSVNDLLAKANELIPKIQESSKEIQTLLNGI